MLTTPQRHRSGTLSAESSVNSLPRAGREWRLWAALGAILLLALILRVYRINASSLWYDEGWSVHLAREPLGRALQQIGSEGHTHPPGYYLLLMGWVRVWGSSVPAVRGFSVLIGVLTVWAIYRLGADLLGRRTGLLAALATALSPSLIVYSQETRMYALLVLAFAWLLGLWYRLLYAKMTWRLRDWVSLVLVETLAIYTHFFSFVVLVGLGFWMLWARGWPLLASRGRGARGDGVALLHWLGSQGLVALAFVPWLSIALQRAITHTTERATAPGLVSFVVQVWSFLLGGHIALYGREPYFAVAATVCLVAVVGLIAWLLRGAPSERIAVAFLGAQTVIPLVLVYAIMQVRPGFHPRYVLMILAPLLVLLAQGLLHLASGGWVGRIGAALMAILWLGASGLAARALLTDGYYVRDNARGTVAYLLQRLPPDAAVLIDNEDWALKYYLEGQPLRDSYVDASRPALEIENHVWAATRDTGTGPDSPHQAALVKWTQGETDRRDLLPYLLEQQGALVETHDLAGYTVFVYDLDQEPPALSEREVDVRIGPLSLLRATVEDNVPADEALTLALTWRADRAIDTDLKVALSLVDERGRRLASSDREIRDSRGAGTSRWTAGAEVVGYYVLHLPAGIPPLTYAPQVTVYDATNPSGLDVLDAAGAATGKALVLEDISLGPARGRGDKRVDREGLGLHIVSGSSGLADGLDLLAYSIDHDRVRSGERLSLTLEWHSGSDALPDYRPALRLVRDGLILVESEEAPVYGHYPTSWWGWDETVVEYRELLIPPDMEGGPAEVQIGIPGEGSLSLGQIVVEQVARSFAPPRPQVETLMSLGDVAELVGYDLDATHLRPGEPLSLTLYWRALGATTDPHVVFVHLLNEAGQVIAQHDGPPAGGERPTTGWVEQEYVTDRHTLQWLASDGGPTGASQEVATLEVGLYEPASGQRLSTTRGDSRLLLPSSIMVGQ